MQLNNFEKRFVQHPLRFWVQDKIEVPLIMRMFAQVPDDIEHALEIGCGFGNGISLIKNHFKPQYISAIDFDLEMVKSTSKRYAHQSWLTVTNADGACLPFDDNTFDMVFNFAVFHHIPNWQQAIKEVKRVLRPNGYFVVEDLYRAAICNPVSKRLFEHPQLNRFDHGEFKSALINSGFAVINERNLLNLAGGFLAQHNDKV